MNVKELIRALQHLPEDAKIICQDIDGNKIGDLYQIAISNIFRFISTSISASIGVLI